MNRVFADTDVILDFLLGREPFIEAITQIMQRAAEGELEVCVSSLTINNLHYIISRLQTRRKALTKIRQLLKLVSVENIGAAAISNAAASKFKDFEDAVQHFCAIEAGHKLIITRNVKDFKESELGVLTPDEFVSTL